MTCGPWPHKPLNGINYYTVYHLSAIHFSNSEYANMLSCYVHPVRSFYVRPLHCTPRRCRVQREGSTHTHDDACEKKRVLLLTYNKL